LHKTILIQIALCLFPRERESPLSNRNHALQGAQKLLNAESDFPGKPDTVPVEDCDERGILVNFDNGKTPFRIRAKQGGDIPESHSDVPNGSMTQPQFLENMGHAPQKIFRSDLYDDRSAGFGCRDRKPPRFPFCGGKRRPMFGRRKNGGRHVRLGDPGELEAPDDEGRTYAANDGFFRYATDPESQSLERTLGFLKPAGGPVFSVPNRFTIDSRDHPFVTFSFHTNISNFVMAYLDPHTRPFPEQRKGLYSIPSPRFLRMNRLGCFHGDDAVIAHVKIIIPYSQ
jgi:hypothetical protein